MRVEEREGMETDQPRFRHLLEVAAHFDRRKSGRKISRLGRGVEGVPEQVLRGARVGHLQAHIRRVLLSSFEGAARRQRAVFGDAGLAPRSLRLGGQNLRPRRGYRFIRGGFEQVQG